MKKSLTSLLAVSAIALSVNSYAMAQEKIIVGLITKTSNNPFFVKMKEGFEAKAKELGVEARSFAGKVDGDHQGQIEAIESLIAAKAKAILITANNTQVEPALKKARAAGILVIALDTPLADKDAADATFATDNYKAGVLIGKWANATLGAKAKDAVIAMLDLNADHISVDVQRDQGFLEGFGIDVKDKTKIGDEVDARIAGHDVTQGSEEGGKKAMETLLQKNPKINLVYGINDPSVIGAYSALKAAGKEKGALLVGVDGACPAIKAMQTGALGATSMQFPLLMASKGVEAAVAFAKNKTKPTDLDTGVKLITEKPVPGVESVNAAEGLKLCWG